MIIEVGYRGTNELMYKSAEGVFRGGRVELSEPVNGIKDETKVIVTFVDAGHINLQEKSINKEEAAKIRAQLASFSEEWDSPEMDIYDDYDNVNPEL